jgi:hypothetical protein
MRALTASAIVALLSLATPALAQTPDATAPSKADTQSDSRVTIRGIQVVDVEDLKSDVRSQVDALVASTEQKDLQSMRSSIDSMPQAASALKAKGRSSAQVVAVNIDKQGILTMFTKRNA